MIDLVLYLIPIAIGIIWAILYMTHMEDKEE